jgi:hypothetical protein
MKPEEIYHDIKTLHETSRLDEATAYLDAGWRLLKVLAKRDEGEFASYVLGWPSVQPAPYPKVPDQRRAGGNF